MNYRIRIFLIIAFIGLFSACNKKEELQSFNLNEVKIKNGPFYKAQQADLKYILELDADRLLAPFLKDAGIKPLKDNYPNWENTGLDGHIGGHYLSAVSFMYASTGEAELLERLKYMLMWLSRCQEKNGTGYVGGIPNGQSIWKEISDGRIEAGTFSLNGGWVPLYNIHKLFAGLYDAYNTLKLEEAKTILIKLTDWFYNTTMHLSDDQIQLMLISEHGGLNDIFTDIANLTGNKKYLILAQRFSHKALLEPLLKGSNELTGMHANTQIPKVIGFAKYALATDSSNWMDASDFFWQTVVDKWTISIGGNSVREHFHPCNDFSSMIESEEGPETCNTYNMLKLTRLLYLAKGNSKYIDYYERALFNHILSSVNTKKSGFVYFTPMRPMHYRVYSQPQTSFWCCVGSGLENHAKYGEFIYNHTPNNLYVNLFIASEVNWKEKDIKLIQETDFPQKEATSFTIKSTAPVSFSLKIRIPEWIEKNKSTITINGIELDINTVQNSFFTIKRKWKNNDKVEFKFKAKTKCEILPDSSNYASFIYGPFVLGAITDTTHLDGLWADDSRMGHVAKGKKHPISEAPSIIINSPSDLDKIIQPIEGESMHFTISKLINTDKKIVLQPFYQINAARYMVYWPFFNKKEFEKTQDKIAEKEHKQQELNKQTIDLVWPGEQQPESDHFVKFKDSETGVHRNRHWRHAKGFFSYELKHPGNNDCFLRITYFGGDSGRKFNILVNNKVIANVSLDGTLGDDFVDIHYSVPDSVYRNSNKFIIKFEPEPGNIAGGVYGVRLLKNK